MTVQPERRSRIAMIHVAKKELAMEEESYRAMLVRVAGKNSSGLMNVAELDLVIAEFRRLGFATGTPKKAMRPLSEKAYVRMIFGLWQDLKPFLTDGSHKALCGFVKRQTGVDNPEWLAPEDGASVIEALKDWLEREQTKALGGARRAGIVTGKARRRGRRGGTD